MFKKVHSHTENNNPSLVSHRESNRSNCGSKALQFNMSTLIAKKMNWKDVWGY